MDDKFGNPLSIQEKPEKPKSNYAVAGIYFYPNDVVNVAEKQQPSNRNELEITDTNISYLIENRLSVKKWAGDLHGLIQVQLIL